MKKLHISILFVMAGIFSSCSEDLFSSLVPEGKQVMLKLDYQNIAPDKVTVGTRATMPDADEKKLNNLEVFIFNWDGRLKGYKKITSGLKQDGSVGEVGEVKTTIGESYIYAVANNPTNVYGFDDKFPANLNEDDAVAGKIDFTRDQFKSIFFTKTATELLPSDGLFLMSGVANENDAQTDADAVTIGVDGSIDSGKNIIKLRRNVSKVIFNVKASAGRTFELRSYDIKNIAQKGSVIKDGQTVSGVTYNDVDGVTDAEKGTDGGYVFSAYIPENANLGFKKEVTEWKAREADNGKGTEKTFTNAPEHGTYVILHGRYTERDENGALKYDGETSYTIHLGDFNKNVNDYDVDRNYRYTYNITVNGVNSIIAEAKRENENEVIQPSAEGVIFDFSQTSGKRFMLDSHYEYAVMQFKRQNIVDLKNNNLGYYFMVNGLNQDGIEGTTGPVLVKGDANYDPTNVNGIDVSWIEFAKTSSRNYNSSAEGRGTDAGYTSAGRTMNVIELLKHLYTIADDKSKWDNGETLTYTCYVKENYYENFTWDKYVNKERSFFVANNVYISDDMRSTYANVAYALTQYPIRTFYNTANAENLVAYGVETINDEYYNPKDTPTDKDFGSDKYSKWDGRDNTIKDLRKSNIGKDDKNGWTTARNSKSLFIACMSRNRDLNQDGKITDDEVRWYTPTISQYGGLVIGETALKEAALYDLGTEGKKSLVTDKPEYRRHYLSSTYRQRTLWAEEGFAIGNLDEREPNKGKTSYVRCVRNLQSGADGVKGNPVPSEYYSVSGREISVNYMDASAVVSSRRINELTGHTETSEINKPSSKFVVAPKTVDVYKGNQQPSAYDVANGYADCRSLGSGWRIPNQRELLLMMLATEDKCSDFVDNENEGAFCRTHFTDTNYRYTWGVGFYGSNYRKMRMFTEAVAKEDKGYIRCIKDNQ